MTQATEPTTLDPGAELDRQVETDEAALDAVAEAPPETDSDALFDKAAYDDPALRLPKVDGEHVDKIALKFSGTIFLDRKNPQDVDLIRKMRLGRDVTLQVEGRCQGRGYEYATNKEGDLDVVIQANRVKVETVYTPKPEEL